MMRSRLTQIFLLFLAPVVNAVGVPFIGRIYGKIDFSIYNELLIQSAILSIFISLRIEYYLPSAIREGVLENELVKIKKAIKVTILPTILIAVAISVSVCKGEIEYILVLEKSILSILMAYSAWFVNTMHILCGARGGAAIIGLSRIAQAIILNISQIGLGFLILDYIDSDGWYVLSIGFIFASTLAGLVAGYRINPWESNRDKSIVLYEKMDLVYMMLLGIISTYINNGGFIVFQPGGGASAATGEIFMAFRLISSPSVAISMVWDSLIRKKVAEGALHRSWVDCYVVANCVFFCALIFLGWGVGEEVVRFVLGESWSGVYYYALPFLMFWMFQNICSSASIILSNAGKSKWVFFIEVARLTLVCMSTYASYRLKLEGADAYWLISGLIVIVLLPVVWRMMRDAVSSDKVNEGQPRSKN